MMSSFLHDLGAWCFRRAKTVVALWLGLLVLLGLGVVALHSDYDDSFTIPGAPSQLAYDKLQVTFPQASALSANAVITVPDGTDISSTPIRSRIEKGVEELKDLKDVTGATSPWNKHVTGMINKDHTAAVIQVELGQVSAVTFPDSGRDDLQQVSHDIQAGLPAGSHVHVGGQAFEAMLPSLSITEVIGVGVALVVLAITLGSLVAAGMPIITAVLGVGITYSIMAILTRFTTVNSVTPMLAVMLGLAVGIDYALFILSRHRDQLRDGFEVQESAARAVATSGSAVVFAGTTVLIALIGLAIANIPFLTVMGVFAAIGVALAVVIALTMLPAFMGLMGERLRPWKSRRGRGSKPTAMATGANSDDNATAGGDAPSTSTTAVGKGERSGGIFGWWVRTVTRVPLVTILVVVVGLGALAVPMKDLHLGLPTAAELPADNTARQTYDALEKKFGPGFNGPVIVTADIVTSTDPMKIVNGLKADIEKLPGVNTVALAVPNQNADTAMIQVLPTTGPTDEATSDLVRELRDHKSEWHDKYGVDTAVTGLTAIKLDVSNRLGAALLPFGIFVVGLCLVLLTVVFRSIAVPIKATIGYLLSVLAAFGAAQLVFNRGIGLSVVNLDRPVPIISFMPIVVMGILFGLAMDYEVFLVSRMREEYVHTGDAKGSVIRGFIGSGKVVTAAAVIMVSVFVFFIPEGMNAIKEIALALAVGILADAFLVRMTLVPAVMSLLGDKAWWLPTWLDRRLPRLDIEGEGIAHEEQFAEWPTPDHTEALHAEGIGVDGLFAGLDLHVEPHEVQAVVGPRGPVTAVLLAVGGRLAIDHGRMRSGGRLLPERASAVRRVAWLVDAADKDLTEELQAATAALTHPPRRPPRLFLIDHADQIVEQFHRDQLESLIRQVDRAGEAAVILGAQRAGRIDWLEPQAVHDLIDQPEPSLGGTR
ncbi:MAG: MMPL family transporter [Cutibacterium granulosum]|uniref:MMPL family transporter n=1 Tax=Cutibacterium granulosum TaxID=33011 RepID=UPI002B233773|nr:MMPL family transporter [Cutibacterium granulosum]MEA5648801.1 MMPL family transporter [Cutibacterium granulosum]MEA5653702.1 MMPL family transporter [Cutibacterium granulosum]MEA5663411.1 MMPL family transporter [Cutibacterium granulosum]